MIASLSRTRATVDSTGTPDHTGVYDNLADWTALERHTVATAGSGADDKWISAAVFQPGGLEYERHAGWGALDDSPVVDQSCLDAHAGDTWKCTDTMHLLLNHITTPFFVAAQQRDQKVRFGLHPLTFDFDVTVPAAPPTRVRPAA